MEKDKTTIIKYIVLVIMLLLVLFLIISILFYSNFLKI